MIGKYDIEIYNNRVHYFLTVERNITLIQGDSATGKSELIRLLTLYQDNGVSSGITVICEKPCVVLGNAYWQQIAAQTRQSIIFIDEGASFLSAKEFAQMVRGSDNYFVLVTRESLPQLPYSISEIYGMRMNTGSKYHNAKRVYNELYQLYHLPENQDMKPDFVLTEDSNSGNDFYRHVSEVTVISSNGKSNVLPILDSHSGRKILVIVDGAAFGPEIGRIMSYIRDTAYPIVIYAPESFEYLILRANILNHTSTVTEKTYLYADSTRYMSWEEFYTAYLQEEAQNTIYQYSKRKLNSNYLTAGNVNKILEQMPEYVLRCLEGK